MQFTATRQPRRGTPRACRARCRFDLLIFNRGELNHIVEVKAKPITHRRGVEATRQGTRYREFGVPVTFVYGLDDADEF